MKMYAFQSVLVSLILAAVTRQAAAQAGSPGDGNTLAQGTSPPSSQTDTNRPPVGHLGIPDADWESHKQWRDTAEYEAMRQEIRDINQKAEPRGYLTSNEVERLVFYMQSQHYVARDLAVITAQIGRKDPARAMLMPHILNLLADPVRIVSQAAAHTLGEIGDKDTISYLEPLLNDPVAGRQAKIAIEKLRQNDESLKRGALKQESKETGMPAAQTAAPIASSHQRTTSKFAVVVIIGLVAVSAVIVVLVVRMRR